MLEHILFEFSA